MSYAVYNAAMAAASPFVAMWLRGHPRYRPLTARFCPPVPDLDQRPLWIQCCSVGEVNTAMPIVEALRDRFPGTPILISASTITGHDHAKKLAENVPVTWFPFDTVRSVRRFVAQANPRALVLVETELWPNVIRETRRHGAPVIIVNGRLSDKHYPRYLRLRHFLRPLFANISAAGMQEEIHAQRLASLGVNPARIRVTGNTKFDAVATAIDARTRARLRAEVGFEPDQPVLVFGSTRPGDEALAAECWRALRQEIPALRLVVAPRHVERLEAAMAPFSEPVLTRSALHAGRRPEGERILILDTVGELTAFYALATVAVVGGSFYPGVEGHNPIEPAALGVPTLFGPYMRNFSGPASALVSGKGAVRVAHPDGLLGAIGALLRDPSERRQLGTRARKIVLDNRGAVQRNAALIEDTLARALEP